MDINISRPHYTQDEFDKKFAPIEKPKTPLCSGRRLKKYVQCSGQCVKDAVLRRLPFIEIMKGYQVRQWLLNDIIAGLSIAVIHIPQGLGFALLTSVSPIYGLYTSFFPSLIYFFFGTSRHNSMGTMAVISLMIGAIVNREETALHGAHPNTTAYVTHWVTIADDNGTRLVFDHDTVSIDVATAVTLLMGLWQVALSLLNLGVIASFMSATFISGFLTGCGFQIFTSQVPAMLGLKILNKGGDFDMPLKWYAIFKVIGQTNVASAIISIIAVILLIIMKEVVNERFKDKLKVPVPGELIVTVLAILLSHFFNFYDRFGVKVQRVKVAIIHTIPNGFLPPHLPPLDTSGHLVVDGFILAIVGFVITVSMAKMMGRKHGYPVDQNQELLACGMSFGVSSFFYCFGGAQAPPRSLVQDKIGGKTQVAGLVSCCVVFLAVFIEAPIFDALPVPVLAAIIVVAILPLFTHFRDLPRLWRLNKYDFLVWVVTCVSTSVVSVIVGIITGVAVSLLTVVLQAYFAKGHTLQTAEEDILRKEGVCEGLRVTDNIIIYRHEGPLFFANIDRFRTDLMEKTDAAETMTKDTETKFDKIATVREGTSNPPDHSSSIEDIKQQFGKEEVCSDQINTNGSNITSGNKMDNDVVCVIVEDSKHTQKEMTDENNEYCKLTVILDCSAIVYIDLQAMNTLQQIKADLSKASVRMVLGSCSTMLESRLRQQGMQLEVFVTVYDAIAAVKSSSC